MNNLVDTYIVLLKLKGHTTWRVAVVNRNLDVIKKHLENEMKAEVEESKVFRVNGKDGSVGRYFLN